MNTFEEIGADDVARLIDAAPFAWIVPHAAPDTALLMPVVRDGAGTLLGHLPKRHPATAPLEHSPRAQLLFLGPHALISSDIAGLADWAPTWNFASVRLDADLMLDDELTDRALAATTARLDPSWDPAPLGPRYGALKERVIGFTATVRQAHPRFKLSQDERPEVRDRVLRHFAGTALGEWLERFVAGTASSAGAPPSAL